MFNIRKKLFRDIRGFYFQARCIYARMAAHVFIRQNILVYIKLHAVFSIVHKTEHGNTAGCNTEKSLHIFRRGKAQAGTAYQTRKILCREAFVACHQQKVKLRFAAVAQEKIFTHRCLHQLVYFRTRFYGRSYIMIQSRILYIKFIQYIVYGNFSLCPAGHVTRSTAVYCFIFNYTFHLYFLRTSRYFTQVYHIYIVKSSDRSSFARKIGKWHRKTPVFFPFYTKTNLKNRILWIV